MLPDTTPQYLKNLLNVVKNSKDKTLIVIGIHEDKPIRELAKHFKKVFSCYEFLKIKNLKQKNFEIIKEPLTDSINRLKKFDIIFISAEMHHFPDNLQLAVFYNLKKNQELILDEPRNVGSMEFYYRDFQNCEPLCVLTRYILKQMVKRKVIKIESIKHFKEYTRFKNSKDMISFYKFILPDHYKYAEKIFLEKIKKTHFPVSLKSNATMYKIKRI